MTAVAVQLLVGLALVVFGYVTLSNARVNEWMNANMRPQGISIRNLGKFAVGFGLLWLALTVIAVVVRVRG